jgi:hypothetical protein
MICLHRDIHPADILSFLVSHTKRLPPHKYFMAIYDYGGVVVAHSLDDAALIPPEVKEQAKDVIAHARYHDNIFVAAWLWEKPLLPPWMFSPVPRLRRKILIFRGWNIYEETVDGTIALMWVKTPCVAALAWSTHTVDIYNRVLLEKQWR